MAETKSSNLLSTALGTLGIGGNIASTLLSNEANKSLMRERNQMAIDQWNRENEYNLPKNQVQRLLAAGLNPALMYENGASGLVSATSPDIQAPSVQSPYIDPLTLAQIQNINADTDEKRSRIEQSTNLVEQQIKNFQQTIEESKAKVQTILKSLKSMDLEQEEKELNNMYFSSVLPYMVSSSKSDALLKQEQYQSFYKGFMADLGVKSAMKSYYNSLSSLTDAQRKQVNFMVDMATDMWNVDKKYYGANAHNQYVMNFYSAKNIRQANEFWNENKNADWWIGHITESLKTLFQGVQAGASVYAAGKGSAGTYTFNSGNVSY